MKKRKRNHNKKTHIVQYLQYITLSIIHYEAKYEYERVRLNSIETKEQMMGEKEDEKHRKLSRVRIIIIETINIALYRPCSDNTAISINLAVFGTFGGCDPRNTNTFWHARPLLFC